MFPLLKLIYFIYPWKVTKEYLFEDIHENIAKLFLVFCCSRNRVQSITRDWYPCNYLHISCLQAELECFGSSYISCPCLWLFQCLVPERTSFGMTESSCVYSSKMSKTVLAGELQPFLLHKHSLLPMMNYGST